MFVLSIRPLFHCIRYTSRSFKVTCSFCTSGRPIR